MDERSKRLHKRVNEIYQREVEEKQDELKKIDAASKKYIAEHNKYLAFMLKAKSPKRRDFCLARQEAAYKGFMEVQEKLLKK